VGELHNNILLGGNALARYGVYEDPGALGASYREVHPVSFLHNLFYFPVAVRPATAVGVLYRIARSVGPLDLLDIALVNDPTLTFPSSENRLGDPLLDPTRHLRPGSPCIDNGTDRGSLPADDFDGDVRPRGAGYDIGPDEY
jgi:hypothetical protein